MNKSSKTLINLVEYPVKKLILNGCGTYIRKWLLSPKQLSLLTSIDKEITTNELAKKRNISIQNANQLLRILRKKGYLTAREEADPTGGYYLIYTKVES